MNLGPVTGGLSALGVGNTIDTFSVAGASGTGYVLSGTAAAGPLANNLIVYKSGSSNAGQVFFGGGFSGRDNSVSMIGHSGADLAIPREQPWEPLISSMAPRSLRSPAL